MTFQGLGLPGVYVEGLAHVCGYYHTSSILDNDNEDDYDDNGEDDGDDVDEDDDAYAVDLKDSIVVMEATADVSHW